MKHFEVFCSQTLSRDTFIATDDYQHIEEKDYDDDGNSFFCGWDDTSETDWKKAYRQNAMTPLDIINCCKNICLYLDSKKINVPNVDLKKVINNCENWIEDDYCVIEN